MSNSDGPFIHRFETEAHKYCYDVNTNRIVHLDQVAFDLLGFAASLAPDPLRQLEDCYGQQAVEDAQSELKHSTEQLGLFSNRRPLGLAQPFCPDHFSENLRSKLSQLVLCTSEQCNLRCRYCAYSGLFYYQRTHSQRRMTPEVALRAVEYFRKHSCDSERAHISFYGGEPLTNVDLIKCVTSHIEKTFLKREVSLAVDTNGTLLTKDLIKYFVKHKFTIQISLDGPMAVHDRWRVDRQGNGTFERVMKNLKYIAKYHPKLCELRVFLVVTLAPPYELERIADFFDGLEIKPCGMSVNPANLDFSGFPEKYASEMQSSCFIKNYSRLRNKYISLCVTKGGGIINIPLFLNRLFEPYLIRIHRRGDDVMADFCSPNGVCLPAQRRLYVATDGKYHVCEKMDSKGHIGNLATGPQETKIAELVDNYLELSREDCINCWAVRLCRLCYVDAMKNGNLDLETKRVRCQWEKAALHDALVLYCEIMEGNSKAFDYVKDMVFE